MTLRSAPALALACFGAACTNQDTIPTPNPVQVATIGAAGGRVSSPDGKLGLVFPAGAFATDTQVSITEDGAAPVGGQVGPTYRLGPAGARPGGPVQVAVELGVVYAPDDAVPVIVRLEGVVPSPLMTSTYDAASRTVRATIDALVAYAVIVRDPRTTCDAADGGMPYDNKVIYPCWITEREPNDTAATAQPTDLVLDEGVDILAFMGPDDDFYAFDVPAGSTGAIDGQVHSILGNYGSCEPGLGVEGELLDSSGNVLSRGWSFANCVGFNYRDDPGLRDLPPGRYTLRLFRKSGSQALPYRLALYLLGPANGTVIQGPDSGI